MKYIPFFKATRQILTLKGCAPNLVMHQVSIYGGSSRPPQPFIVMEKLAGSLDDMLYNTKGNCIKGPPLPLEQVLKVGGDTEHLVTHSILG